MYNFWRNNKNVISVGLSLFVVSVTALMVLLNNENLSADIKTNLIHETANSEHPLREAVEYGPYDMGEGAALLVGMDGLISLANEKFGESTDFDPAEVKGQLFFNYIHPEDLAGVLSAYGKVLSSKEPQMLVGPFRMKNAAGEYTVQMAAMQPVVEENKMQGVAVMTRAISADLIPVAEIEIEYENEKLEESSADENLEHEEYLIDDLPEIDSQEVEIETSIDSNIPAKGVENKDAKDKNKSKDKRIRNESNEDKRLVVDNLANLINKVYRDPDVLAYLF